MSESRVLVVADPGLRVKALLRLLETLEADVVLAPASGREDRLPEAEDAAVVVILGKRLPPRRAAGPPSVVVGLTAPDPRAGLALLKDGRADHVLAAKDLVGIYGAVRSELLHGSRLRQLRTEKNRSLRRARLLEEVYDATVENLMMALDLRDVETFGHSQTVAKYSEVLAGLLGVEDPARRGRIRLGALLHDIGKIAIPDSILKKPGDLSPDEWDKIKLHPTLGYGLVKEIKLVAEVGNIILYHHEKFDGTGYPAGLKAAGIPLEARIFALADALDAMTAHRPYREARDHSAARTEILGHRGTQFDPSVVKAFASLPAERWERIRFETTSHLPPLGEFRHFLRRLKP